MANNQEKVHLYTTADVKRIREKLLKDQNQIDPITGFVIPEKQAVLDHCHDSQYVRAVLHRQSNAVLGKIENMWMRYLSWWYVGTLPEFLRGCADYLEKQHDQVYLHPSFLKHLQVQFNKLNEKSKQRVLEGLGSDVGTNTKQRKELFRKKLLEKQHTFDQVLELIEKEIIGD